MKQEALKLALEALENGMKFVWTDPEREAGFVAIDAIKEALAEPPAGQPLREPVATISITRRGSSTTIDNHFEGCVRDWPEGDYKLVLAPTLPVQERNFCPRCGKRTADLTTIHTCTPPREST